jgi:hypothetical protein
MMSLMSASPTDEDPVCYWSVGRVVWCIVVGVGIVGLG